MSRRETIKAEPKSRSTQDENENRNQKETPIDPQVCPYSIPMQHDNDIGMIRDVDVGMTDQRFPIPRPINRIRSSMYHYDDKTRGGEGV